MNRTERLRFYCLSDSSEFSTDKEKKDVSKIITGEKTLWDKFKYTSEEDLVGENKKWVDAGVYQEYQKAFSGTNLADKPAEVKKWQDSKDKTKLSSSEAATAYKNGWLSNEVKEKKGSLDGENYLYDNVLTLKKDKVQEEEKNKQIQQQRTNAIQEVKNHWNTNATNDKINNQTIQQILGADWEKEFANLTSQEAINNKEKELKTKINEAKNKEQQNQAVSVIENYWDKNKDSNGKINGQTIEQLLGSNWKDNFNSLATTEQIKKEQDKLIAAIDKAKEETNKKTCNIVEHQRIEEDLNRLKLINLSDYSPLTQKETKRGKNENGDEYTQLIFNESFQTKDSERNYFLVYDSADQDLKDLTIKQPKIWVLTKYLAEEAHSRMIKKEDLVNPASPLFAYLNTLQDLAKTKQRVGSLEEVVKSKVENIMNLNRDKAKEETGKFIKEAKISAGLVRRKYAPVDYEKILDDSTWKEKFIKQILEERAEEKPNLDEFFVWGQDSVKVVVGICAAESVASAAEFLEEDGEKVSLQEVKNLVTDLQKAKSLWDKITENIKNIPSQNNPFYLEIIGKQKEHQQKVENLLATWKQKEEQLISQEVEQQEQARILMRGKIR